MNPFTEAEAAYLGSQRLARIATVDSGGRPHVVPVGFRFNAGEGVIDIGGHFLSRSKKWRNLAANPHVAVVIDDLQSVDPWIARGIEIRGRAELHDAGGRDLGPGFEDVRIRIHPDRIIAWGLDGGPREGPNSRDVN